MNKLHRLNAMASLPCPTSWIRRPGASIRERAIDLVDNWELSGENTVFTTEEQERVSNHEFLSLW